jgi:regulator of sigma E protease
VAQAAGLSVNDLIVSIGGERQPDVAQVIRIIQSHANQPLALEVQREGQIRQITLTPAAVTLENGKSVGRAGFQLGGNLPMVDVSYGLLDSVWLGVTKTYDTAWFSLKMMGKMLIGEVSTVNDDVTDNIFREPIGRFAAIEEDVAPTHLLVSDYDTWLK